MIILSDIYNIDPYQIPTTDPVASTFQIPNAQIYRFNIPDSSQNMNSEADGLAKETVSAPSREWAATPESTMTASDQASLTDSSLPDFEMVDPPMLNHNSNPYNSSSISKQVSISPRISALPPALPPPSGPLPVRPRTGSLIALLSQPSIPQIPPPSPSVARPASISTSNDVVDTRSGLTIPSSARARGNASTHRRVGSDNKLEALHEEEIDSELTIGVGTKPSNSFHRPHDQLVLQQAPGGETPVLITSRSPPPLPSKDSQTLPRVPISIATSHPTTKISSPPLSPATPKGGPFIQSSPTTLTQQSSTIILRSRGASAPTPRTDSHSQQHPLIINATTSAGTISQRRTKTSTGTISSQCSSRSSTPGIVPSSPTNPSPSSQAVPTVRLPGSSMSPLSSGNPGGRLRSSSQPPRPEAANNNISVPNVNSRPSVSHTLSLNIQLPRKPSFPSRLSSIQTSASTTPTQLAPSQTSHYSSYIPSSPLPPLPPADAMLKPYHLMALLWTTMTSKSGGYITRRLHVPNEVWSQGGVKLSNLPEKVKVVEVLSSALEEVQMASHSFALNKNILMASSCTPDEAERWLNKLDDWNAVCDSIVTSFGRKLGVNEGFVVKKGGGVGFDLMSAPKQLTLFI